MTEPTADPHRRRLDAIAGNAVGTALNTATPETGERWWFSLSLREHVGRAVVQALVDAGAIPPPPADLDTPRHTAGAITDDQLAALYGEIDWLHADLIAEQNHNGETCEAVQRADRFEAAVQRVRDALESVGSTMASDSRDWGVDRRDAWLWGILLGWDCDDVHAHDETCINALDEVAAKARFSPELVATIRRHRAAVRAVTALDAQPEPAADTDTAPLTDHRPKEQK
ncbi:hypothetical protein [Embleya sp. NPDC005971]|uniref:hypothetical protein n=1 Tax=Embleya sp. NPDC005971 TaxID=3156724 RepID=UPI0033E064CA